MYITLTYTFDSEVQKAIRLAKENNLDVIFDRDGEHGTADLAVILAFEKAGFAYRIYNYPGRFEKEAIRVEFHYKGEKDAE